MEINGEAWLVGKDVAEALGYTNPSKALADHVDSEDKLNNDSLSSLGQRESTFQAGDNTVISKTTYVLQRGIDFIRRLIGSEVMEEMA